jgi:hypothetical protein
VVAVELRLLEMLAEEMAEEQKCRFLVALMAQLVAAAQGDTLVMETPEQEVLVGKVGMVVVTAVVRFERQMVVA